MPSLDLSGKGAESPLSVAKAGALWTVVITAMACCVIATAWFPLLNIGAFPSNNYNEGWNAYRQWMTVEGQPLYGNHPTLWTTNYPFLSFHIIGLLGGVKQHMVLAGRIVCLVSLMMTSGLVGGIVRIVTGSRAGALYAGLCLFASLASFFGVGRASNDPELLSLAVSTFGIFAYVKAPKSIFWPLLSAIAFAVSLFIKHDLIVFPFSICIHLLITRNWRGFVVFIIGGMGAAVLLLALSSYLDGPHFLAELLHPRAYSWHNLSKETLHYLVHFLIFLVIGVVVLLREKTTPFRSLLFTMLISTHIASVYFSGGDGVASNIFYPALIASLLTCVVGICRLEGQLRQNPRARKSFQAALVIATLSVIATIPSRVHGDCVAQLRLTEETKAARQATASLLSTPGAAICEDLLLCYDADKPMDLDPYYTHDQILTGQLKESTILTMLDDHRYAMIQLDGAVDAASIAHRKTVRFSGRFLHTLLSQYRPILVTQFYSVFVPRN
ncbi:hypothetical protein ACELLULO517_12460 [Acidisoma cellulosilytica]|uniref:Glycosyltransferase RgtA/B/C/D-like domain-containing protein n=1 Tax=Acidisoma cellulosilyticum TaxID=2802395 RepID=A0A963Z1K4_9PROT|nr:glycosyltransferase family 39 protein [Acidisoma cellulosilyticum]MCB8881050.1 hypothetical protein [Acidisoma cellulosilyticum]